MNIINNMSVFLLPALIIFILFLRVAQKMLQLIAPNNRKIKPAYVWFTLIPIPILIDIWWFILVSLIAKSIELEYKAKNIPFKFRPTYLVGMIVGVMMVIRI